MSTSWTYLLADVLTNRVYCEVPLTVSTVTQELNKPSKLSATLAVKAVTGDPYRYTTPGRSCVYVLRDGQPWWGGIIWTRTYSDGKISLGAGDWWTYYDKRYLISDRAGASAIPAPGSPDPGATAAGALPFAAVDQVQIVRTLLARAAAVPGGSGDLNLQIIEPATGPAIPRTQFYENVTMTSVGQMLTDLCKLVDGPDLMFGVHGFTPDGKSVQRALWIGCPTLTHGAQGIMWEYKANMLEYEWESDGAEFASRVWLKGAGSGDDAQIVRADNANRTAEGWPMIEYSASGSDNITPAQLRANAVTEAAGRAMPEIAPSLTVRTDLPPHLNFAPGDHATLLIEDDYFRTPMQAVVRIVTITANVNAPTATIVVNPILEDIA